MSTKRGAGMLKHRVAFDSPVEAPDGQGGTFDGWLEELECAAGFTRMRGGERVMADRLEGLQPTVVRVRRGQRTKQINTDWRCRVLRDDAAFDSDGDWTGEVFNVRGFAELENRQFIDLMCESGVAA